MTTPSDAGNLADLVRRAADRFGERPALIGDGPTRSWSELDAATDSGAADLLESGATLGARVLISLPTSADLAVALTSAARAGLVGVPLDPDRPDTARVAALVRPEVVITSDPQVAADSGVPTVFTPAEIALWWTGRRAPVDPIGGGEDLALLARASRSGRAVMIPHRAVLAAVDAVVGARGLTVRAEDRAVLALPLYHLAGLVTAFLPLAVVGAAAVIPGADGEDPDGGLGESIHRHRVTLLPGSPMVYRRLLRAPGAERSLASVRLMTSGAAPLLPEDFSAIRNLTGQSVWEGYGISESSSVVATSLMTPQARPGSVGLPVAGVQVRIIADSDDDESGGDDPEDRKIGDDAPPDDVPGDDVLGDDEPGDDVPGDDVPGDDVPRDEIPDDDVTSDEGPKDQEPCDAPINPVEDSLAEIGSVGEVGRIALRGPTLFLGYWPDGADGPGPDGWYLTSDVGYTDDHGELHLVDRVGDTFVVAGFTVYPREIERVLAEHPYVAEAVVIGVPIEDGTHIVALITPQPGTRPTDDDLAEFLDERLPVFKRPSEFRLIAELPRTELGRIDRQVALTDYLAAGGLPPSARAAAALSAVAHPSAAAATAPQTAGNRAEEAAELDELGRRLPGTQARGRQGNQDNDDDLFGEDYT